MRIVLEELKKIFNLKIITILIGFTMLYYFMFITFHIEYFPNGHPETEMYNLGVDLISRYGNVLDEVEFNEAKKDYIDLTKKADEFIRKSTVFQSHNIKNYEEFVNLGEQSISGIYSELSHEFKGQTGYLIYELQTYEKFIEEYEGKEINLAYIKENNSSKLYQHLKETYEKEEKFYSILPQNVFSNFLNLNKELAVLLSISLIIFISPYLVKDYSNDIVPIQISTKIGRNLLSKQLIAASIGSFAVILFQLIIFLFAYSLNNTGIFFKNFLNSFYNFAYYSWGNFTFIEYIILATIFAITFGFGVGLISFFLSKLCKNYIAIIAVQIPLVFIYYWMINRLFKINIFGGNFLASKPLQILMVLMVGLVLSAILIIRERKIEV